MSAKKQVYLAGPFFSDAQIARLEQVQTLLRENPTIGEIFRPGQQNYTAAEMGSLEWQNATFGIDTRQINQADIVIAVLDFELEQQRFEPDSGTMWECGYAFAHNKPVILVRFKADLPLNLMLAGSATATFNGESELPQLSTYDFFTLQNKYIDAKVY